MPKVKVYSVSKEERYKIIGEFFDIVTQLKNKSEVTNFLIGLLTHSESLMMARRIQIAKLIIEGNGYEEIRSKLGVSHQTIGRIDKWLHQNEGAYKEILRKYLKKMEREKDKRKGKSGSHYSPGSLLNRYPQHKFLKDLLDI